jgi:hypothetical protein
MKGYIEEGGWVSCTMDSFGTPRQLVARHDAQVKRHDGKILLTKIDTAIDKQFVCNSPVKFWTGLAALAVGIAIALSGPVGWIALGACAVAAVAITIQAVTSHACNGCLEGLEWKFYHKTVKIGGQNAILYNYSQLQCSNGGLLIASETFDKANALSNEMALNNWASNSINIGEHLINGYMLGKCPIPVAVMSVTLTAAGDCISDSTTSAAYTIATSGILEVAKDSLWYESFLTRAFKLYELSYSARLTKETLSQFPSFLKVLIRSPRLTMQLATTGIMKDFVKGLGAGFVSAAITFAANSFEEMFEKQNEELLKQKIADELIDGSDIIAINI